jgi:hypothetical protein
VVTAATRIDVRLVSDCHNRREQTRVTGARTEDCGMIEPGLWTDALITLDLNSRPLNSKHCLDIRSLRTEARMPGARRALVVGECKVAD